MNYRLDSADGNLAKHELQVPVVIVGAGPYGLSVAAHLDAADVPFRIFGNSMSTWRKHMPKDMLLKSDGFASSLSAPSNNGTLQSYCAAHDLPYRAIGLPVPLERFVGYATWFQKRFVPNLEEISVVSISRARDGFVVELEDKTFINTRCVVLSTGITWFSKLPEVLSKLPADLVSHSFDHRDASRFARKNIVVVGAGASPADTASLFAEAEAHVRILSRQLQLSFHHEPSQRSPTLVERIRSPQTGIGPGWRSKFFTSAPLAFRRLPSSLRSEIVRRHPRPAPGWFMRRRIEGRIPLVLGSSIEDAKVKDNQVELTVLDERGTRLTLVADHVVSATGYDVDIRRILVLSPELREAIEHDQYRPVLSDNFECSIKGLYFVGPSTAHSFGPLVRFVVGAQWAAPRLARHLFKKLMTARSSVRTAPARRVEPQPT